MAGGGCNPCGIRQYWTVTRYHRRPFLETSATRRKREVHRVFESEQKESVCNPPGNATENPSFENMGGSGIALSCYDSLICEEEAALPDNVYFWENVK